MPTEPNRAGTEPDVFLTAYDPTDLPGTSVDPLGFERAYLFLADAVLPGLTNVVGGARYFSVLCAGAHLADVSSSATPREQVTQRRAAIMRLERLWALANVLRPDADQQELLGIRGIRYVQAAQAELQRTGARYANIDFKLLARQATYGVLGIYGNVAEGMHLIDRATYSLTPGLGDRLAEAFVAGTRMPDAVRKATAGDGTVRLDVLAEWGTQASLAAAIPASEARPFRDALFSDPIRRRMCDLLAGVPSREAEDELTWMARLRAAAVKARRDGDLADALAVIQRFERCYRLAIASLMRLLVMCRASATGAIDRASRTADGVLGDARAALGPAFSELERTLADQQTLAIGARPERLEDALSFLRATAGTTDSLAFCERIVARHAEIQRGKFDGGRRKAPWLDESNGALALTPSRVPDTPPDITGPEDIRPHAYRTFTAQRLLASTRSAAN
jgi:hypothetical protein